MRALRGHEAPPRPLPLASRLREARLAPARSAGFSLLELVVALAVLGVLAGVAVWRGAGDRGLELHAAAVDLRAVLRQAQRYALAKGRTVCVQRLAPPQCAAAQCLQLRLWPNCAPADPPLALAGGMLEWGLPTGMTLTPVNFTFGALGQPSAAQTILLSAGDESRTVTVEAQTGYVR